MIQIYTGNGKGKTTAALGLALRACGGGLKVYIAQFVKGRNYSELKALKRLKNIKVEQFGRGCFIKSSPCQRDICLAENGLERIKEILSKDVYNVVILDEVNVALNLGLLKLKDVLECIKSASKKTELVLTGRNAHPQIVKIADLVSCIEERKHYFKKGLRARRGIEF